MVPLVAGKFQESISIFEGSFFSDFWKKVLRRAWFFWNILKTPQLNMARQTWIEGKHLLWAVRKRKQLDMFGRGGFEMKYTNNCLPGPQNHEKWRFYTPKYGLYPLKMKVLGSHGGSAANTSFSGSAAVFFHRNFAPKLVLDDSMNRTTVVTVLGRFCLEGCSMNM